MDYLVCDKCGGYYELQPGESLDDFHGNCDCGGNLKQVPSLDSNLVNKPNLIDHVKVCPACGEENDKKSAICVFCGQKFNKTNFISFHPVVSIILGIITFYILSYCLLAAFNGFRLGLQIMAITAIFGGFIATYFSKQKKMQYGIYAGASIFAIYTLLILVYQKSDASLVYAFFTFLLFTSIGGSIGAKIYRLK